MAENVACGLDEADLETKDQDVRKELREKVRASLESIEDVDVKYGLFRRFADTNLALAISNAQSALLLLEGLTNEESRT